MSDEYTPTMDHVRNKYARIMKSDGTPAQAIGKQKEFDRAIAAHDRALRERIAREIEVMLIGLDAWRGSEVIAAHDSALSRAARIARGEGSE